MRTPSSFRSVLVVAFVLGHSTLASADLLVQLRNGFIKPGETTTMDVLISGVDFDGNPMTQDLHEYELLLNTAESITTAGTTLEFVDPQSEAFLTDGDYVFFGSSDVVSLGDDATVVRTDLNTNDSFVANDASFVADVENDVPVGTDQLLLRFELAHMLNGESAPLTIGDEFELTVDLASGFFDSTLADVDFNPSYDNGQAFATITVVPEPSAVGVGVLAGAILFAAIIRRHRKQKLAFAKAAR